MDPSKATVFQFLRSVSAREQSHGAGAPAHHFPQWEATLTRGASKRLVDHLLEDSAPAADSRDAGELVNLAFQLAPEGIVIIRPSIDERPALIAYVNDAYCRMSGVPREEIVGFELKLFGHDESDEAVRDALDHPLCQRHPFAGEAIATRKNGTPYSVELLLVPIHGGVDDVIYWVAYIKDITERKSQLAALERQALYDELTGLPNRAALMDRIGHAVLAARRTAGTGSLMIMDLDGFKDVNDSLGHHAGDVLLQQVAERVRREVRESDTVARLGGDEFAFVFCSVEDSSAAMRIARKILKSLEEAFVIEDESCHIGASIGVALFPEHGHDAVALMKSADAAMYSAKRGGRGCVLYSAGSARSASGPLSLGSELRQAIDRNELRVFYQPKIHLRTGIVTRVEALVRWKHPTRGLMLPDSFIPLAERTGLIKPLTEWVIENALAQCADWQSQGMPIHVAVNLSSKVLQDHSLPQTISTLLDRHKVSPHTLKLEITESSIMVDPPQVLAILSLIQTLGVRLSLDDFGTGYSSLSHLRELPVDEIKIDKSFVMGMANSASDAAIVRATIDLSHQLGRQVVAEGVDDTATCHTLSSLGCDLAQGYSFSRPLPAKAFERWLDETSWGHDTWRSMELHQVVHK